MMNTPTLSRRTWALLLAVAMFAAACGSTSDTATEASTDEEADTEQVEPCYADPGLEVVESADDPASLDGTTITLATHDSFALSDETLAAFTEETGITVEVVAAGDAGQLVSQAVLTAGTPTADVMFGIDNSFMCRGVEAGLFSPYVATGLDTVPEELQLDPFNRVTAIDFSDCLLYTSPSPRD